MRAYSWLRLVLFLIGTHSLLISVSVFLVRSESTGCILESDDWDISALYDIRTKAKWRFKNEWYHQPYLYKESHYKRYAAMLEQAALDSRSYHLVVQDDPSSAKRIIKKNAAYSTVQAGLPGYTVVWSPDDRWIVYQVAAPGGYIEVYDLDGTIIGQIDRNVREPRWSTDSTTLAFFETPFDLEKVKHQMLLHFWSPTDKYITTYTLDYGSIASVAWSPTHRKIAFITTGLTNSYQAAPPYRLFVATPESGVVAEMQLDAHDIYQIEWSADGKYLHDSYHVFRVANDKLEQISDTFPRTDESAIPKWTADGKSVVFINLEKQLVAFDVLNRSYTTLLTDIVSIERSYYIDRYLIQYKKDGMLSVGIINLKYPTPIELLNHVDQVKLIGFNRYQNTIQLQWSSGGDDIMHVAEVANDGRIIRQWRYDFDKTVQFRMLNETIWAFKENRQHYFVAGIVNSKTGIVSPQIRSSQPIEPQINYNPYQADDKRYLSFLWVAADKHHYETAYDESGKRMYEIETLKTYGKDIYPSPQSNRVLVVKDYNWPEQVRWDVSLIENGTSTSIRRDLAAPPRILWVNGGKQVFIGVTEPDGIQAVEVFDANGQMRMIQRLEGFSAVDRIHLRWVDCGKLSETTKIVHLEEQKLMSQ